jgi:hypothetical protein
MGPLGWNAMTTAAEAQVDSTATKFGHREASNQSLRAAQRRSPAELVARDAQNPDDAPPVREAVERRWRRMTGPVNHRIPLLMYGILLVCLGITTYLFGVLIALPRHSLDGGERFLAFDGWIVWYSGMPLMLGLGLATVDLFLLFKYKRPPQPEVRCDPIADPRLVVAPAAYDDEASIADAVRDFRSHPLVDEVIVVSNNSGDNTLEWARPTNFAAAKLSFR